jgi:Fe2+ transport system protein B
VAVQGAAAPLRLLDDRAPMRLARRWPQRRGLRRRRRPMRRRAAQATRCGASSSAWAWTNRLVPRTFASDRIDRVVLHPVLGPLLLAVLLFLVFQAVFAWAEAPMGWIEAGTAAWARRWRGAAADEGWLRSLLVDGVIAGVGGVLVFLPQILILFFFILVLEDSGYLPRAAFLLDRLMGSVGLSGRSFIPLLSSFACAIPGIMATRTIANPRDRLATIMIAPLMTCSARLPVYALLIGAFVPQRRSGGSTCRGWCCSALYLAGIVGALAVAWCSSVSHEAAAPGAPLMMELPAYHWPHLRNIAIGLWQRVVIFLRRVGGIILALMVCCGSWRASRRRRRRHRAGRSSTAWPACSARRWRWCSRPSASTGRSASRWCRGWRRARWR